MAGPDDGNRISRTPAIAGTPSPDVDGDDEPLWVDLVDGIIDKVLKKRSLDIVDWLTSGDATRRIIETEITNLEASRDQFIAQGTPRSDLDYIEQGIAELKQIKSEVDNYAEENSGEYDDAREDAEAAASDAISENMDFLGTQENVRITQGPPPEEENCKIGPYSEMRNYCARYEKQAHHIVPDYTLRYGTRDQGEHGLKRIPDMPSLQDGNTICLEGNGGNAETEHGRAHYFTDRRIKEYGERPDNPIPGTVPLGVVMDASIDGVSRVKSECTDQIENAVDTQFNDIDETRLLRSTKSRLPHDEALEALSPYADDNNRDGD